jgi:hypothetical protein
MKINCSLDEKEKRFLLIPERETEVFILGELSMVLKREEIEFTYHCSCDTELPNKQEIYISLSEKEFISYLLTTIK